jgi:hypothetical protein
MIQLDVGHFQLLSVYPALPSARHWNLSLLAIKSTQWMPEVLDCTIEAWCHCLAWFLRPNLLHHK